MIVLLSAESKASFSGALNTILTCPSCSPPVNFSARIFMAFSDSVPGMDTSSLKAVPILKISPPNRAISKTNATITFLLLVPAKRPNLNNIFAILFSPPIFSLSKVVDFSFICHVLIVQLERYWHIVRMGSSYLPFRAKKGINSTICRLSPLFRSIPLCPLRQFFLIYEIAETYASRSSTAE
ncbi:hypothetical protein D3C75_564490 [compost metagenome]